MSDDSKELSRMEDILSGEDYLPKKPMSRIEELLLDGAMVPKVDSTDNGKVLKVIDGEWKPGEDVSGDNLPPVSSLDNGKVLKVVSGEWNIGDDKSDTVIVQMGVSYESFKDSNKVTLPENINIVLKANYYSNPPVPTYLITSDSVIFEPREVNKSSGSVHNVQIRWGRMYSTFDSVTHEKDIYNDSISYNTQNQTTEATFSKSKAIPTIPPVDSTDEGKVMQVGNDGTWQANDLPTYDDVPQVEAADVGKVLKATAVGEYDWGDAPDPLPSVTSADNGKVLKVIEGGWDKGDIPRTNSVQVPPVIFDDNGLKKIDDFSDFPGIKKVYLTQSAYNALTTAEKEDLSKIYYISDYEFYPSDDGKVVIRFNDDGTEKLIFFDGFVDDWSSTPYSNFPEELRTIVTNNATWDSSATILSTNYDSEGVVRSGNEQYFGIRTLQDWHVNSCNSSGGSYAAKNKANYAILDMLDNSTYQQSQSWSDPYDIPYGYDAIYYGGKEYEDFDIPKELPYVTSADEGKALVVNSQGIWVKGDVPSVIPVRLSKSAYDALTPEQKTDASKLYLIDGSIITDETLISPDDLTDDDGKVIGTAAEGARPAWKAFDGVKPTSGFNNCFYPAYSSDPCYVGYHFTDKAHRITKVKYRVYWLGNNQNTITNSVYVEGSNDGTNWIDIGGGAVAMSIEPSSYSDYTVPCDMNEWSYVRIRFANAVNVTGGNKFFAVSEMEIYATETAKVYNAICYNGAEYASLDPTHYRREISQTDYDALPDTKNSDGIIYFITDNG